MSNLLAAYRRAKIAQAPVIKDATVRQFDGGLNAVDSDLNLSSRYAKRLINMFRAPDGSLQVRYGSKLFSNFEGIVDGDRFIYAVYYRGFIIGVTNNGEVVASTSAGDTYVIFDSTIASTLPGAPAPWSTNLQFASGNIFNNELILTNGVDKPLLVQRNLFTGFLQDLGTGSNLNTPVARFCVTQGNFCVMAGDFAAPSILHISNQGTSGTWFGDGAPNDAIQFDCGPFVEKGSSEIIGLGSFRGKLVVLFPEYVMIIQLGVYDTTDHVPVVEDGFPNYGAIAHHSVQSIGEDMFYMDATGVPGLQRALLTSSSAPVRDSQLIDPLIARALRNLSKVTLQDRVYSVMDRLNNQLIWSVPYTNNAEVPYLRKNFVYTYIKSLKVRAWSTFEQYDWDFLCSTEEGRVIGCRGLQFFALGNVQEPYSSDLIGYAEPFSDGTSFTDYTGWTPATVLPSEATGDEGLPIHFDWVMPWSDLQKRSNEKQSRFYSADTEGRGRWTTELYVDRIFQDRSYLGESFTDGTMFTDGFGFVHESLDPQLSLDFVGGDRVGFAGESLEDEFGGGRISSDERLFDFPAPFMLFRLRHHGITNQPLRFVGVTLKYQLGNITRQ